MSSKATLIPRTLMRSLSAVESMKEDYHMGGGLASDAVESLLLLGQTPIIAPKLEDKVRRQIYDPFLILYLRSFRFPGGENQRKPESSRFTVCC